MLFSKTKSLGWHIFGCVALGITSALNFYRYADENKRMALVGGIIFALLFLLKLWDVFDYLGKRTLKEQDQNG